MELNTLPPFTPSMPQKLTFMQRLITLLSIGLVRDAKGADTVLMWVAGGILLLAVVAPLILRSRNVSRTPPHVPDEIPHTYQMQAR